MLAVFFNYFHKGYCQSLISLLWYPFLTLPLTSSVRYMAQGGEGAMRRRLIPENCVFKAPLPTSFQLGQLMGDTRGTWNVERGEKSGHFLLSLPASGGLSGSGSSRFFQLHLHYLYLYDCSSHQQPELYQHHLCSVSLQSQSWQQLLAVANPQIFSLSHLSFQLFSYPIPL